MDMTPLSRAQCLYSQCTNAESSTDVMMVIECFHGGIMVLWVRLGGGTRKTFIQLLRIPNKRLLKLKLNSGERKNPPLQWDCLHAV